MVPVAVVVAEVEAVTTLVVAALELLIKDTTAEVVVRILVAVVAVRVRQEALLEETIPADLAAVVYLPLLLEAQ
jgi:hypothetical protein